MEGLFDFFEQGGIWMPLITLPLLLVGIRGAFLLVQARRGKRGLHLMRWWLRLWVGSLIAAGLGVTGWRAGIRELELALHNAPPSMVDQLRELGEKIAAYPLIYGLVIAGLLGLLSAETYRLAQKPRSPAPEADSDSGADSEPKPEA